MPQQPKSVSVKLVLDTASFETDLRAALDRAREAVQAANLGLTLNVRVPESAAPITESLRRAAFPQIGLPTTAAPTVPAPLSPQAQATQQAASALERLLGRLQPSQPGSTTAQALEALAPLLGGKARPRPALTPTEAGLLDQVARLDRKFLGLFPTQTPTLGTLTALQAKLGDALDRLAAENVPAQAQAISRTLQARQPPPGTAAYQELQEGAQAVLAAAEAQDAIAGALARVQEMQAATPLLPVATAAQQAAGFTRRLFPFLGAVTGAGLFATAYREGRTLAPQAATLAFQAGGLPDQVYATLPNVGWPQAFSAQEMAQATSLQGEFGGTGVMGFLFRDALQTAQFARYLGLDLGTAAQIMGGYQVAGAFQPGQEATAAAAVLGAATASGANTQAFASGLAPLVRTAEVTAPLSATRGPAQVLSIADRLGSLGLQLFRAPVASQTLQTMAQGFSRGPLQGSGATVYTLLPVYQDVEKVIAKQMPWIKSQALLTSIAMSTPIYANEQVFTAALRGIHDVIATAPPRSKAWTIMQLASSFLGNTSEAAMNTMRAIGQPDFMKNLQRIESQVRTSTAHGAAEEHHRRDLFLSSIGGAPARIESAIERVGAAGFGFLGGIGGGIASILGQAPGVSFGLLGAGSIAGLLAGTRLLSGVLGGGGGALGGLAEAFGSLGTAAATSAEAVAGFGEALAGVVGAVAAPVGVAAAAAAAIGIPSVIAFNKTRQTGTPDINLGPLGDFGALAGAVVNALWGPAKGGAHISAPMQKALNDWARAEGNPGSNPLNIRSGPHSFATFSSRTAGFEAALKQLARGSPLPGGTSWYRLALKALEESGHGLSPSVAAGVAAFAASMGGWTGHGVGDVYAALHYAKNAQGTAFTISEFKRALSELERPSAKHVSRAKARRVAEDHAARTAAHLARHLRTAAR
jgi:hypothetical protein